MVCSSGGLILKAEIAVSIEGRLLNQKLNIN